MAMKSNKVLPTISKTENNSKRGLKEKDDNCKVQDNGKLC